MAWQAARRKEHHVDPDVVARPGEARGEHFGGRGDAAQAILVDREIEVLGPVAPFDLDECDNAAVAREISKLYEQCVTGTLTELSARYADAPPKGEIVVIVGPPGEAVAETADDATLDAALREAMADKPVAQAAKAVAKRFGLDRHDIYARALTLKGAG